MVDMNCATSIKMQMIRMYMHDLTGHFTDDPGVFGRMIVDQGKSLQTASPAGWAQHIVNCTTVETLDGRQCVDIGGNSPAVQLGSRRIAMLYQISR